MSDKDKKQQAQAANESTAPELNSPDFQVVLKALLAAYQPILEQQLNLAKNPQELQKEAGSQPPTCDDEFAEANALFGKFLSDDVALRLIPEKNRAQIGPIENWRWCQAAAFTRRIGRGAPQDQVRIRTSRVLAFVLDICQREGISFPQIGKWKEG